MIHFRFFLISIVAVFLALGIGIVLGSGFLGDPLLDTLEGQVKDAIARNGRLQEEVIDLEGRTEDQEEFAEAVEPLVVEDMLSGRNVVVVELDGTDGVVYDGIERVVAEAGGNISARIVLRDRLAFDDDAEIADALTALGSPAWEKSEVSAQVARRLGERLRDAAGAAPRPRASRRQPEATRVAQLLEALEQGGFLSVEEETGAPVPRGADFLLVGGADGDPPLPVARFLTPLASTLSEGQTVVVGETSESDWAVVESIRTDDSTASAVSTVDNIETAQGRISLTMALGLRAGGGHWGTGEDAQAPLPTPAG